MCIRDSTELRKQLSADELNSVFRGQLSFENEPMEQVSLFDLPSNQIVLKVGTEFILVDSENLEGINIEDTGRQVEVNGGVKNLFRGQTFEDSEKVDQLIDIGGHQVLKINDYISSKMCIRDREIQKIIQKTIDLYEKARK